MSSNFGDKPQTFSQATTATFGQREEKPSNKEQREGNKRAEGNQRAEPDMKKEVFGYMREFEESKNNEERNRRTEKWRKVKEGFNSSVIGNVFQGYIASGQQHNACFIAMISIMSFAALTFWNVFLG